LNQANSRGTPKKMCGRVECRPWDKILPGDGSKETVGNGRKKERRGKKIGRHGQKLCGADNQKP